MELLAGPQVRQIVPLRTRPLLFVRKEPFPLSNLAGFHPTAPPRHPLSPLMHKRVDLHRWRSLEGIPINFWNAAGVSRHMQRQIRRIDQVSSRERVGIFEF